MLQAVLTAHSSDDPTWIDICDPSPEELADLAKEHNLHPKLVQDCMEPAHLPKLEAQGNTTFIIIRYFDQECQTKDDSVQSMTRKIAFFIGDRFLFTIHRKTPPFLATIVQKYQNVRGPVYLQVILIELLMACIETYHLPLERMEFELHDFETSILKGRPRQRNALSNWEDLFRLKCRLSVIKRILWHSLSTVQKFIPSSNINLPLRQDLKERIDNLAFFSDGLLDDLTSLLNIQLSLATHRASESSNKTNDVMKILTLFSAFFLPLNFIVGVYGMNFEYMPELKFRYGYAAVWAVLIITTFGIYRWFTRKGWIRWGHLS